MPGFKVAPNYKLINSGTLSSGSLVLFPEKKDKLLPCLVIKNGLSSENNGVLLQELYGEYHNFEYNLDHKPVLEVLDEWRFRLNTSVPPNSVFAPIDVPIGKIAVAEGGWFFKTSRSPRHSLYYVDLEQAQTTASIEGISYYSDWTIETRADASEPWQLFYNPLNAARP